MDIESKDLDNIRKYLIHEIEEYEVYEVSNIPIQYSLLNICVITIDKMKSLI